ncbi:putrescine ABC transporter permease PotI [Leucobacter alluvii]|uniref:Putrescine ABC transporter permease PotI n=1 Tax=Leucobacter alluvii TaxID=340321 RepID=A0ABN3B422_9MICO
MNEWKFAWRIMGILVLVFLFIPILFIVIYSFNSGRLLVSWGGFSFDPYIQLGQNDNILRSVWTSVRVALLTALLATVLGSLAGIVLARIGGRGKRLLLIMLALVLVTPEIVNAVALLPWFVFLGVDLHMPFFNNGVARMVIGHSLFSTAVVAFVVQARVGSLNASLDESAADLYATPVRRFMQITVPLMMPAVLSGALLAFTMSLDNVVISSFVSVQGSTPWPVVVFGSLKQGLTPEMAAMSVIMFLALMLTLLLAVLVLRRSASSKEIAGMLAGGSQK